MQTQTEVSNELDNKLIQQCDPSVRHRRRIELQIVRRTINDLKLRGFTLVADNGEEMSCSDTDALVDNLFACDEANLHASGNGKNGWVFFVMGNDGYDVISDYTVNLEEELKGVNELADKLEEEGR